MAKRTNSRARKGEAIDARAQARIEGAGWTVIDTGHHVVAKKRIIEENHSETFLFESSFTLEALAKNVKRREREESTSNRKGQT